MLEYPGRNLSLELQMQIVSFLWQQQLLQIPETPLSLPR
jgi:hypothetical protein